MRTIHTALVGAPKPGDHMIALFVERATLAKRRWRATAEDGQDFGFDLEQTLAAGDVIFREGDNCYVLSQKPEPVLEIITDGNVEHAAALGWKIGNLHFPIQILKDRIRVVDDPAIRQMLDREAIPYSMAIEIFHPLMPGHSHSHSH